MYQLQLYQTPPPPQKKKIKSQAENEQKRTARGAWQHKSAKDETELAYCFRQYQRKYCLFHNAFISSVARQVQTNAQNLIFILLSSFFLQNTRPFINRIFLNTIFKDISKQMGPGPPLDPHAVLFYIEKYFCSKNLTCIENTNNIYFIKQRMRKADISKVIIMVNLQNASMQMFDRVLNMPWVQSTPWL